MLVVLVLTSVTTGLTFLFPGVLAALRRSPGALSGGQWWRPVTALFVHAQGWPALVFNMSWLILLGNLAERLFGTTRFLIIYFVSGLVGQAAGLAWQPWGAGASVGVCGPLGALLSLLLRPHPHLRPLARVLGIGSLLAAITLMAFQDNHGPALIAGFSLGALLQWRDRWVIRRGTGSYGFDSLAALGPGAEAVGEAGEAERKSPYTAE